MNSTFFSGCDGYLLYKDGPTICCEYTPGQIINYLKTHSNFNEEDLKDIKKWMESADLGDVKSFTDNSAEVFTIESNLI